MVSFAKSRRKHIRLIISMQPNVHGISEAALDSDRVREYFLLMTIASHALWGAENTFSLRQQARLIGCPHGWSNPGLVHPPSESLGLESPPP